MEAGKRNITGIFNRTGILIVPYFQRSYVWKEEQWERFLEDMRYISKTNFPDDRPEVARTDLQAPLDSAVRLPFVKIIPVPLSDGFQVTLVGGPPMSYCFLPALLLALACGLSVIIVIGILKVPF